MINEETTKLQIVLAKLAKHNIMDLFTYLTMRDEGNLPDEKTNDDLFNQAMELVEQGADLSASDGTEEGATLIHHLVSLNSDRRYDDHIKALLHLHPSLIDQKNALGRTPLFEHLYSSMGVVSLSYFKYLVSLGAKLDVLCPLMKGDDCTLLHIASLWGNREIAKYLLDQGLNINARTSKYWNTPLIMAVAKKDMEMVRFLIHSGANVSITDLLGRSARFFLVSWPSEKENLELFNQYVQEKELGVVLPMLEIDDSDTAQDDSIKNIVEPSIKKNAITDKQFKSIVSAMESARENLSGSWFVNNYSAKQADLNDTIEHFVANFENKRLDMANNDLIEFAKTISLPRGGMLNFYKANYGETRSALAFYQNLQKQGLGDLAELIKEQAKPTAESNVAKYEISL